MEFEPTKERLHVFDCSNNFGIEKEGYGFGKEITNNGTDGGKKMWQDPKDLWGKLHNQKGDIVANAIETVEKNKKQLTEKDRKKAKDVWQFQHTSGHPSEGTIVYAAMTNSIKTIHLLGEMC